MKVKYTEEELSKYSVGRQTRKEARWEKEEEETHESKIKKQKLIFGGVALFLLVSLAVVVFVLPSPNTDAEPKKHNVVEDETKKDKKESTSSSEKDGEKDKKDKKDESAASTASSESSASAGDNKEEKKDENNAFVANLAKNSEKPENTPIASGYEMVKTSYKDKDGKPYNQYVINAPKDPSSKDVSDKRAQEIKTQLITTLPNIEATGLKLKLKEPENLKIHVLHDKAYHVVLSTKEDTPFAWISYENEKSPILKVSTFAMEKLITSAD